MIFVKNSRNANTKIVSIWQVIVTFQCDVYICIFGFIEPRIKRSPTYPNNQQYATPTVYPTAESYPAETTNHSTVHQPVYPNVLQHHYTHPYPTVQTYPEVTNYPAAAYTGYHPAHTETQDYGYTHGHNVVPAYPAPVYNYKPSPYKKVKFDYAPVPQFGIVTRTRDDRPCDAMATCDLLEKNGLIVQCELPRFRQTPFLIYL